jgi:NAD(P)-dependent dehydrogenase (short-subunit alcohol dehydrogenase family)
MIALVTGATDGIGRHIAERLVHEHVEVLITGRDPGRGHRVAEAIGATFVQVDHATVEGNRALAHRVRERTQSLDILVNNVGGAAFPRRTVTDEGHEAILALNYIGPVVLTEALLPALAPDARIVNVVSSAYRMHKGDPFAEPTPHVAIAAYARAKQLEVLATMSLARRLAGTPARVNAVSPGMAWTPGVAALTPEAVPAWRYIWPIVRAVQRRRSAAKAARLPASLALRPEATGQLIESNGRAKSLPSALGDPGLQDSAWDYALAVAGVAR